MVWIALSITVAFYVHCTRAACVDVTAKGYYTQPNRVFNAGLPPNSNGRVYVVKPSGLTYCELEELSAYCVDRINLYRSGALRFTNGTVDPGVPSPPLSFAKQYASCSSSQAFGDLQGSTGSCNNAHHTAFSCPGITSGGSGQNSCCLRQGQTKDQIKKELDGCLQQMWDEGIGQPDSPPPTPVVIGHWLNMRSKSFKWATCGLAYSSAGVLWMNQDFFGSGPASLSACSCTAAGASDGCGGICVNPDGSKLGSGNPVTGPFSIAAVVMALLAMIAFVAVVMVCIRKNVTTPLDGMGTRVEYVHIGLQFVTFVFAAAAVGSPLWAEGNGITLSLWKVCVPSVSGQACEEATLASSGSKDVLVSVQAFAVLGMIFALFAVVGYVLAKYFKSGPGVFKGLFGLVIFESVVFFLAICFFGGYFLDELGGALTAKWGCGLEILCWILSALAIPFAKVSSIAKA